MDAPVDLSTEQGLETYRHSASHLMAHAVKRLFPQARLAIGPAIADGFYYDFDLDARLTPEDLEKDREECGGRRRGPPVRPGGG